MLNSGKTWNQGTVENLGSWAPEEQPFQQHQQAQHFLSGAPVRPYPITAEQPADQAVLLLLVEVSPAQGCLAPLGLKHHHR